MSRSARRGLSLLACALLACLSEPLSAGQGRGRGLGEPQEGSRGRKVRAGQEAPAPGALNGAAAVEALRGDLGQRVRDRGGDAERYAAILAADESAWIADDGQMMFVDVIEHEEGPGGEPEPVVEDATGPPPVPIRLQANGLPIRIR